MIEPKPNIVEGGRSIRVAIPVYEQIEDAKKARRRLGEKGLTLGDLVAEAWAYFCSKDLSVLKTVDTSVIQTTIDTKPTELERPAVEYLSEILRSGDREIIDAITANLSAFVRLIRVEAAAAKATIKGRIIKPPDSVADRGSTATDGESATLRDTRTEARLSPRRHGGGSAR